MAKFKSDYMDISSASLEVGDMLVIFNPNDESKTTSEILAIEEVSELRRTITLNLLQSTSEALKVGTKFSITLDRDVPCLGIVVRKTPQDQVEEGATFVNIESICAVRLRSWLDGRIDDSYGASYKSCIKFLKESDLLPMNTTETAANKFITRLVRNNKSILRRGGAFIFSTGSSNVGAVNNNVSLAELHNKNFREVSMSKLRLGLRLIMESGILGEIRIVEDE